MKGRFPKLARSVAGIYLGWSLLVFFGSFESESHSWWPIFLNTIIWPLGAIYQWLDSWFLAGLTSNSQTLPAWGWALDDYLAGAFYIVMGTVWIWFLGRLFSLLVTRVLRDEDVVAG